MDEGNSKSTHFCVADHRRSSPTLHKARAARHHKRIRYQAYQLTHAFFSSASALIAALYKYQLVCSSSSGSDWWLWWLIVAWRKMKSQSSSAAGLSNCYFYYVISDVSVLGRHGTATAATVHVTTDKLTSQSNT